LKLPVLPATAKIIGRFSFSLADCFSCVLLTLKVEWVAQVSIFRPGFSRQIGSTETPRSQNRDLGHPLILRPRHFPLAPFPLQLGWQRGGWRFHGE
jgi:hypothetical protein